jgi:hypothetical protein
VTPATRRRRSRAGATRARRAIVAGLALLAAVAAPPPGLGQSGQMESIDGSSALVGVRNVSVPPVERSQTTSLVDAGTIDCDGYSRVAVNFAGRVSGDSEMRRGAIGVILVPDIDPYDKAFRSFGLLPAAVELTAQAEGAQSTFMAKQVTFDVGFPRYRVLFYNSTNWVATVHFFAYRHRV